MGEYARIQMAEEARRMFGGNWEPEDFENEPVQTKKPICPKCGKKFRVHLAVRDHMRDKHAIKQAEGEKTHDTNKQAALCGAHRVTPGAEQRKLLGEGPRSSAVVGV